MKFTAVDIATINLKDERFRISYYFSLENLLHSIKETGLLNPPVLTHRDHQPIVVSGWRRILACQKLSMTSIPVFVTDVREDLGAFKIPVYENLAHREYNPLEKAEILRKLKFFGEDKEGILRHFLPLLQIPPTVRHLSLYLSVSRFDPKLKKVIHEKNIPFSVLQLLVQFKTKERTMLLPFLIPLGQNKQKELLTNLFEIARRDKVPVTEILNSGRVKALLSNEKLSSLQKADKFREFLKEKRNPALAAWIKAFDAVLKELNLSEGTVIIPSPFFEGEDFSLNFSFKNQEEFIQKLLGLKQLSTKKEFLELLRFTSDD